MNWKQVENKSKFMQISWNVIEITSLHKLQSQL